MLLFSFKKHCCQLKTEEDAVCYRAVTMPELQTVVQLKNDVVQNRMEKLLLMSTESWGNEEPYLARGEAEFEEQAVENKIGRLC